LEKKKKYGTLGGEKKKNDPSIVQKAMEEKKGGEKVEEKVLIMHETEYRPHGSYDKRKEKLGKGKKNSDDGFGAKKVLMKQKD